MSSSSRFVQVLTPGLSLVGFFFGMQGLLTIAIPCAVLYWGHRSNWSVARFSLLAAFWLVIGCWLASLAAGLP